MVPSHEVGEWRRAKRMKLSDLSRALPENTYRVAGTHDPEIAALGTDSRTVTSGMLFFCVSGLHTDAHRFAPQAVAQGAVALVVERPLALDVPQIVVSNVRYAMAYIAAAFYGYPARSMHMIGLTGTKGKTTTCYLIRSILETAGHPTGLIGTVGSIIGDVLTPAGKTTPDPIEFQQILRDMKDAGMEYVVMEVSAHALDMHRVEGVYFDVAGITNLSQDHLDYFDTMETYLAAKLRLFDARQCDKIVVNADDDVVYEAMGTLNRPMQTIGIRQKALVYAGGIEFGQGPGARFTMTFHKRAQLHPLLQLCGLFNVYNALMAAAMCDAIGIPFEAIQAGIEAVKSVPGRIELLDTHTPYQVILDYAHSPDALENVLSSLRKMPHTGRLIALFGCGGGRDHGKRPIMGEIGGRLADFCILTSDNPRNEAPMSIIDAIEDGIRPTGGPYIVIENRREAIRYALSTAQAGDVIVLAGKGHETYQEIMGVKHPFDEKVVVKELLDAMNQN